MTKTSCKQNPWWIGRVERSTHVSKRKFCDFFSVQRGTPRESDTASRREEACLLNPCNVVAQLVTSQPVTVDATVTFFSHSDVLGRVGSRENSSHHPLCTAHLKTFCVVFATLAVTATLPARLSILWLATPGAQVSGGQIPSSSRTRGAAQAQPLQQNISHLLAVLRQPGTGDPSKR